MVLLAISLLTILAGTLLLARFKKEAAGIIFTVISWFFIVVGCLLFIGAISLGVCRLAHHDGCCYGPKCQQEMMMRPHPGMPGMMGPMGPGCCMHKDSTMMKCCQKHMMTCDSMKKATCPKNLPSPPPPPPPPPIKKK